MEIVSFTYCEDVQNNECGKSVIIAPIQMLTPVSLPTNYSFTVSFGIYDIPKDGFEIRLDFFDSEENAISENKMMFPPIDEKEVLDIDSPLCVQINMGFRNLIFRNEGKYISKIYLNGELYGEYPIYLVCAK